MGVRGVGEMGGEGMMTIQVEWSAGLVWSSWSIWRSVVSVRRQQGCLQQRWSCQGPGEQRQSIDKIPTLTCCWLRHWPPPLRLCMVQCAAARKCQPTVLQAWLLSAASAICSSTRHIICILLERGNSSSSCV